MCPLVFVAFPGMPLHCYTSPPDQMHLNHTLKASFHPLNDSGLSFRSGDIYSTLLLYVSIFYFVYYLVSYLERNSVFDPCI